MNIKKINIIFFLVLCLILSACSTRRFVPDGKYLVRKNVVEIKSEKDVTFTKSDLSSFTSQKTNKRFLGIRFQLWTYYVTEKHTDKKIWKWLNETVGTPPIYVDKSAVKNDAVQMERYLDNVGYFNSKVEGTIKTKKSNADIIYTVTPTEPYKISEVNYKTSDSLLSGFVDNIKHNSLVKPGDIYNVYTMDDERTRLTEYLKNNGYYFFSRNYIFFEIDSAFKNHTLKVDLRIDDVLDVKNNKRIPHNRYFINKVNIFPNYNPLLVAHQITDSSYLQIETGVNRELHELYFYSVGDFRMHPKTFSQVVQIHDKEYYALNKVNQTYKSLGNFQIYNTVNIEFDTAGTLPIDSTRVLNLLNCNIMLQRAKVNSYVVQLEGTNSGGDLGIRGGISFANNNIFRRAEVFRIRLNGGLEAQQISTVGQNDKSVSIFNTSEFGIDASINFPRFLSPIPLRRFRQEYQPKTKLAIAYNQQIRSYYKRVILTAQYGYDWMATNTIQHIFTPISLNTVKVEPSLAFQEILNQETNQRVKDQYSNHLLFGLNYSFIFNNQNINKLNDFVYFRGNFESSGNLLSLFNKTPLIEKKENYFELLGIRYGQYVRTDIDFRYYHNAEKDNWLVFRSMIGLGVPYGNSKDMPFERGFYAGGANGMRGWRYRELGPGSYNNDTLDVERIGDIQIEVSAEYRFPISGFMKGALFVDVGNIWTINDNPYLSGGQFKFNEFYKELAVDAGFGLRFDFSFFIFRLDIALPLRDPSKTTNSRWIINSLHLSDIAWNFGIGYPF